MPNQNFQKPKIIKILTKYWLSRGVKFGEVIFNVKPKNFDFWQSFLKQKKYFFLKNENMKKLGIKNEEHVIWIKYLKYSFWKLYTSENKAFDYFKNNLNIELKRADFLLDKKYGIDFYFKKDLQKFFLIVKDEVFDLEKFIQYKQLSFFKYQGFNLINSKILLFSAKNEKLYSFEQENNYFELITDPANYFL